MFMGVSDASPWSSWIQAQEAKVLEAKDKVLNPLKYYRDSPVTPWRKRADEASSRNI